MNTPLVTNTLRRIGTDPTATADLWGPVVAPLLAVLLLLAFQRWLGTWPDLWRARRIVLPRLGRFGEGDYAVVDELDDRVEAVGVEAARDAVPDKTRMGLRDEEFVGVLDAPPDIVREEFREMPRVWPEWLASIQYEMRDAEKVYEVGSYAYRPQGFLGMWQVHVRLTPRDDGRKTALWAHWERSAWRAPVRHYNAEGWSSEEGVREIAALFASDEQFSASDRARGLVGDE